MTIDDFRRIKIPDAPGVYFFEKRNPFWRKAANGRREILYIGKATSLEDRVKSYFSKDLMNARGPAIVDMVFQADNIKWQETDSVLEALILETNLIKKHQPKYNVKEKSDKSFNYVGITKSHLRRGVGNLPRVVIVRGKNVKHQMYNKIFGPYPNGSQLREALKIVRKIFPFLDEKSRNYIEFYKQINLVPDLNDHRMYLQNIRNVSLFFMGRKKRVLQNLKRVMMVYAKNSEFEKAGEIKRRIFALQHVNDVALYNNLEARPKDSKGFRIEAYDIAHMLGKNMVGVMVVAENGEVAKSEYRKFAVETQKDSNDTGALAEILTRRFAHQQEWRFPDLVVVDGGVAQINIAKSVLKENNVDIPVVSVVKDEHHKPKDILGDEGIIRERRKEILLANSEAHRFAVSYHKKVRAKSFLK